jgi:hypothetical protein
MRNPYTPPMKKRTYSPARQYQRDSRSFLKVIRISFGYTNGKKEQYVSIHQPARHFVWIKNGNNY